VLGGGEGIRDEGEAGKREWDADEACKCLSLSVR
jgi:hypothetical protein